MDRALDKAKDVVGANTSGKLEVVWGDSTPEGAIAIAEAGRKRVRDVKG